jgi:toxin ParE1/3/4
MTVVVLPDAQNDLSLLQNYMLSKWGETLWLKAENEIFKKMMVIDTGILSGVLVKELAVIGVFDYKSILTSHHRMVYKKTNNQTYIPIGTEESMSLELFKKHLPR